MSVCAVVLVKDEADIIATTLGHLATQVDAIMVADNGSTDGTRDILTDLASKLPVPVTIGNDPEVGYYQARKVTQLAEEVRRRGFDWVLPCDADEIWYSDFGRIGDLLNAWHGVDIVEAKLYDHVATGDDNPEESDPTRRLGWHRWEAAPLPKVVARTRPGLVYEMGNHGAHYPGPVNRLHDGLVIRHFPYRSVEQMVSKVRNGSAAYKATNLSPSFGQHWRDYGALLERGGEDAIAEVFTTWFYVERPADEPGLIFDPAPVR